MEKKILLLSNSAPPGGGQKNTLTNFEVNIPSNFLESHKSWSMALESVGFTPTVKKFNSPQK